MVPMKQDQWEIPAALAGILNLQYPRIIFQTNMNNLTLDVLEILIPMMMETERLW